VTYIIGQPCIGTKDASCIDVCPVDCIHPTREEEGFAEAEMLYIDPEECIDCAACEPACPVNAIGPDDVPIEGVTEEEWEQWGRRNAIYFLKDDEKEAGDTTPTEAGSNE
jgi:NAD-dependent dihydropyrimidine dehydrogenase PreA subunit